MTNLYPELEPFAHGMLNVTDGHQLYWEACGNPDGKPVLVVHGGPGSGSTPGSRRFFDPAVYRIILFDQRNCGRSLPHASEPDIDLSNNTTAHLIADMEALRKHLGIEHWMLYGGSWGSTLILAYAEEHPQRVTEIVIAGVTMTRPSEIDWLYHGVRRIFPAEWARFQAGVPEAERDGDLVEAYARLLFDSDEGVRAKAAADFHEWEYAEMTLDPEAAPSARWLDPAFQLARARIVTHYFRHKAWLEDGILLRNAHRLSGIPGVLIHGRLDLSSPLITAWELSQAWPDSELVVIRNAGHSPSEPSMTDAILTATDRFGGK